MTLKFLYRGVVVKVQSPEAILSLGVVPVVSFAAPKSKERIKASVDWNVGTLEKSEMPLKVGKTCMLTDGGATKQCSRTRQAKCPVAIKAIVRPKCFIKTSPLDRNRTI